MADSEDTADKANGAAHAAAATVTRAARSARTTTRRVASRTRSRARSAALEVEADSLEDQVAQLQTDLRSITTTLQRMGSTAGNELKSSARARADELAARGQSALDSASDEFGAFERQIKDTIREKPLTAVAGAVALGFILAVITR